MSLRDLTLCLHTLFSDESGLLREHTHVGTVLDDYSFKVVFVAREEKVRSSSGHFDWSQKGGQMKGVHCVSLHVIPTHV